MGKNCQESPFQQYCQRYDNWFAENPSIYQAELRAIRQLLHGKGIGIEIGVGTGRFAEKLGIKIGIEPSAGMGAMALTRGIMVVGGKAEKLPLAAHVADYVLMVTTICFVDDIVKSFLEAGRILRDNGCIIIAFIDRNSFLGRIYNQKKKDSLFYRDAYFFTVSEVLGYLRQTGFGNFTFTQTLFGNLQEISIDHPVEPGYGKGGFVVVRAEKSKID
jgi:SAM-dependent methyltransferase